MRPTVITGLPDSAPAMTEEIFGPVTCVVPFDEEQEVFLLSFTLWEQKVFLLGFASSFGLRWWHIGTLTLILV